MFNNVQNKNVGEGRREKESRRSSCIHVMMKEKKRDREKSSGSRLVRLNKESDNGSGWRCCRINQLLIHGGRESRVRKAATPRDSQLIGSSSSARLDSIRLYSARFRRTLSLSLCMRIGALHSCQKRDTHAGLPACLPACLPDRACDLLLLSQRRT